MWDSLFGGSKPYQHQMELECEFMTSKMTIPICSQQWFNQFNPMIPDASMDDDWLVASTIVLREMFNQKAPYLMGKSMVSGVDFRQKTNPLLVVSTILKNMSSSNGMMTFPNFFGKIKNVPNHQPGVNCTS